MTDKAEDLVILKKPWLLIVKQGYGFQRVLSFMMAPIKDNIDSRGEGEGTSDNNMGDCLFPRFFHP